MNEDEVNEMCVASVGLELTKPLVWSFFHHVACVTLKSFISSRNWEFLIIIWDRRSSILNRNYSKSTWNWEGYLHSEKNILYYF